MISTELDVLVVGAGPTGLVLAAELARHGARARLIDAAASPAQQSRAIGIQARTLELLDTMGLAERFVAAGQPIHAVNLYSGPNAIARLAFDGLESRYPYVLSLPQSATETMLAAHLERLGGRVERGLRLESFAQDDGGVTATLAHAGGTETVRARWLAGCDGAHSTLRHQLDMPFEGKTYAFAFVLADVTLAGALAVDEAHVVMGEAGLVALFPLPGGRHRLVVDVSGLGITEADAALCRRLVAERVPLDVTVTEVGWVSSFHINARMAAHMQAGRVFLLGDAAHIHSPALAQGMNTGIQDAVNLAWKLGLVARGVADPGLLDSYEAERRPVEQGVLQQTDLVTRLVSLEGPVGRALRDRLAPIVTGFDAVQQRARRIISELAVNYRGSPIVEEHWQPAGPPAGDRVPDRPLTAWDGARATTLLEALRQGTHLLLLALDGAAPAPVRADFDRAAAQVQAVLGDLIHVYRPSGDIADWPAICLIRPDGYVGFRGSSAHLPELAAYLARIMPGRQAKPASA